MKNLSANILLKILIAVVIFVGIIKPDNPEYDIKNIPSALLSDADAIIRKSETRFEVKSDRYAILKKIYAVTIFNKNEQQYGNFVIGYDKFSSIEELRVILYDSKGERIRKLNSDEISDLPATSSFSLYEDNRVKHASLYHDQYPYTIELFYEIEYDGFINWPDWNSRKTLDPVQISKFEVIVPQAQELRFWVNNPTLTPSIETEWNKKRYKWEVADLPKLSRDAIGEDIEDIAEHVKIAPENFRVGGYKGNMTSWKDFGMWYYNLAKDKRNLSEPVKKEIGQIVANSENEIEKIKKIYQYMQSRTRYVSVQLGIGGWQPFDANYVHEKSYGDCKALSNYTIALLEEVGVTAYPVLIKTGNHRFPIVSEFPSNQFNHAIVCVPTQTDTFWLECTNPYMAFERIGSSNENRGALLITENGGILINTPVSHSKENIQKKMISVKLSADGNLEADALIEWSGNQQAHTRNSIAEATYEEKEKFIVTMFEVPSLKINKYFFYGLDKREDQISAEINMLLSRYASVSGGRIFFKTNLMERRYKVPKDVEKRLSPVRFSNPYWDVDSIYYTIPDGYEIEALPKPINLSTSFGEFSSKTELGASNKILFVRSLEIKDYSIPASDYKAYREFFAEVVKSDRGQVVLVKK
jgi:hypothetical protein